MKILLNIEDSVYLFDQKEIEMSISYGGQRKVLHEIVPLEHLSKDTIKDALTTRLKQLVSQEIENYVNSQIS